MTMIETVRQRQKNSTDFASCYDNLCALQNSCPLGSITANLDELTIDCNADRIRHSDWTPILNALKINKTLKIVAFRSYWQQTLYPDGGKIADEFCFVLSKPVTGFSNYRYSQTLGYQRGRHQVSALHRCLYYKRLIFTGDWFEDGILRPRGVILKGVLSTEWK